MRKPCSEKTQETPGHRSTGRRLMPTSSRGSGRLGGTLIGTLKNVSFSSALVTGQRRAARAGARVLARQGKSLQPLEDCGVVEVEAPAGTAPCGQARSMKLPGPARSTWRLRPCERDGTFARVMQPGAPLCAAELPRMGQQAEAEWRPSFALVRCRDPRYAPEAAGQRCVAARGEDTDCAGCRLSMAPRALVAPDARPTLAPVSWTDARLPLPLTAGAPLGPAPRSTEPLWRR